MQGITLPPRGVYEGLQLISERWYTSHPFEGMHGYRPCTDLVLIDGVTAISAFPARMNRLELLSQLLLMKPMSHQPFTELLSMPFHSVRLSPLLHLHLLGHLLIQYQ
jgi:hypothetical protein